MVAVLLSAAESSKSNVATKSLLSGFTKSMYVFKQITTP
jgi:hypothetical protein